MQARPSIVMKFESEADRKRYFTIVLIAKDGHVGAACKALGITRKRYRKWAESDAEFAQDCQDAMESLIDLAQSKLVENIRKNVSKDIQFLLKTQARHRGYGDKVEHEHSGMIGHAHAIGVYPPEPKSIAEWEKMVAEADQARKLREGQQGELTDASNEHASAHTPTDTTDHATVPRALSLVPA